MSRRNLNSGFTIIEVLVSLFMMSIVLYITGQTLNIILKRMGLESRLATAVVEAKQVTNVLLTELRMASSLSPYLLTDDITETRCGSAIAVGNGGDSLTIRVSHDDPTGFRGRKSWLIGYQFDEDKNILLRGQVELPNHLCSDSGSGDPLQNAETIAERIVRMGSEPIFVQQGSFLLISIAVEAENPGLETITQPLPLSISIRSAPEA